MMVWVSLLQSKFSTEQLMDHARELGFVPDTTWTRDFAIGTLTQHHMRAQNETAAAGQQVRALCDLGQPWARASSCPCCWA